MARKYIEGQGLDKGIFLQSCFYPLFLILIYSISGGSMLFARILQLILGAFSCALVCSLANRLYGRRVALVAGVIAAFYAPLFFYEGELLATGWSAFWSVALVHLFLIARTKRQTLALSRPGYE